MYQLGKTFIFNTWRAISPERGLEWYTLSQHLAHQLNSHCSQQSSSYICLKSVVELREIEFLWSGAKLLLGREATNFCSKSTFVLIKGNYKMLHSKNSSLFLLANLTGKMLTKSRNFDNCHLLSILCELYYQQSWAQLQTVIRSLQDPSGIYQTWNGGDAAEITALFKF